MGEVSSRIGVPYIVLHKENLYAAEGYIKQFKIANKYREKFKGSHVFVYNNIVKKTWLESNIINKSEYQLGVAFELDGFIIK